VPACPHLLPPQQQQQQQQPQAACRLRGEKPTFRKRFSVAAAACGFFKLSSNFKVQTGSNFNNRGQLRSSENSDDEVRGGYLFGIFRNEN
jgi:hypothetical protein